MADYLLLSQEHEKLRAATAEKLRRHCTNRGVDYDAIAGAPRPGAIAQDPLLNEVYDLQEQDRLLDALLSADGDDGGRSVDVETPVEQLAGVGPDLAAKLRGSGFETVESVKNATVDELRAVPGVGEQKANQLKEAASGA